MKTLNITLTVVIREQGIDAAREYLVAVTASRGELESDVDGVLAI